MATTTLLEKVKLAMRRSDTAFDDEINDNIAAAIEDLRLAGVNDVVLGSPLDYPLVVDAVVMFCRKNIGVPADADRLKKAYDEKKQQMLTATGYTVWG